MCISVRIICISLIKIIQIMAAYVSNHIDNVPCFTQPFCTFAYEKTRSMIPRDFWVKNRLDIRKAIPKQSRNITETLPKHYRKIDRGLFRENSTIILKVFSVLFERKMTECFTLTKSPSQQPRLCLKNYFIVLLNY